MYKTITIPLMAVLLLFFYSCTDDDYSAYYYDDPTIYSQSSDNVQFSEVICFIRPYIIDNGEKKYILTKELNNITVSINQQSWTQKTSYPLDVDKITDKEEIGGYWVTTNEIAYPVTINVRIRPQNLTTAGQYAALINNYYSLTPGTYVCRILSFDLNIDGSNTENVYTPTITVPLEVKDKQASANIGFFDVKIK